MKPSEEKQLDLAGLRFPKGAEFSKELRQEAEVVVQRMLQNLPDNYPKTLYSRIAQFYRAYAEERVRLERSLSSIANDQFYTQTRPEYLFQILGDLLFIEEKAGGVEYTDKTYREFLLKVKRAYFGGSTIQNMNRAISDILGIPVNIKEMYLQARRDDTGVTIKDSHRLVLDILIDELDENLSLFLGGLIRDLYFFIDLIKPSHTLFDTRLVWTESLSVVGCPTKDITWNQDANGNTLEYVLSPLANRVFSIQGISLGLDEMNSEGIVTTAWLEGVVSEWDPSQKVITLEDGTSLVITRFSKAYALFPEGIHRVDIDEIPLGETIRFFGWEAAGSFNFYDEIGGAPQAIQENWYAQFDPEVMAGSEFQARVIFSRDTKGWPLVNKGCSTNLVEDVRSWVLSPYYEDMRDSCEYPLPRYCHYEGTVPVGGVPDVDGFIFISEGFYVREDMLAIRIDRTPLVNSEGKLLAPGDIDSPQGLRLFQGIIPVIGNILEVAPFEGLIFLSNPLTEGLNYRVYYFCTNAFPTLLETEVSRSIPVLPGVDGDVPASTQVYPSTSYVTYLAWPTNLEDKSLYGDETWYQVDRFPVLTREGDLASVSDIKVFVDDLEIPGAVSSLRALLGHVQLNFIPPAGAQLHFSYYYQSRFRQYHFVVGSQQHLLGTAAGARSSYDLLIGSPLSSESGETINSPIALYRKPLSIGYRYRAVDLTQSSVASSKDTLPLNFLNKPALQPSFVTPPGRSSQAKSSFSGEHLYDTNKIVELTDSYLTNGLPAILRLYQGVPPFFRTFTSYGNFRIENIIVPNEPSAPGGGFDIPSGLEVIARKGGIIQYSPVEKYLENGWTSFYSDTVEEHQLEGSEEVTLSTLCEDRALSLDILFGEEYYPNRELRLNDYKDHLRRYYLENTEITGSLEVIPGSLLLKSSTYNWAQASKGSVVAVHFEDSQGNPRTSEVIILSLVNSYTVRVDRPLYLPKGGYTFTLKIPTFVDPLTDIETDISKAALRPDTLLNEVVRRILVAPEILGLSSGSDPMEMAFADPDSDPYPRNDNPAEPSTSPPLLTSQIDDQGSRKDFFLTEEEADKMVKFRNWDQDLLFVRAGVYHDAFQEAMDDTADSIRVLYWNVDLQEFQYFSYKGMVLITQEDRGTVLASNYPAGVIRLANEEDDGGLSDTYYQLLSTVIRQILPDNTVDIITLDEFVRLP